MSVPGVVDPPIVVDGFRLFGRGRLLLETHKKLENRRRLILRGPSGIGKSLFAAALQKSIMASDEKSICILHECESQAHPLPYFLGELTRKILEQVSLPENSIAHYSRTFIELSTTNGWLLFKSAVEDLAKKALPDTVSTIKGLAQIVENIDGAAAVRVKAEKLQKAAREDQVSSFRSILDVLSKNNIQGSIIIDRLEGASVEVARAISSISHLLPDSWKIVILANDEITQGIQNRSIIWPEMCYEGAEEIVMPGMSIDALEDWFQEAHGYSPKRELLQSALDACEGRPLYLSAWIDGASPNDTRDLIKSRIGEFYKNRISDLDKDSRSLLYTLSLLPEGTIFDIELCSTVQGGKKILEVNDQLTNLEKALFLTGRGKRGQCGAIASAEG